jgi:hypothetical protein
MSWKAVWPGPTHDHFPERDGPRLYRGALALPSGASGLSDDEIIDTAATLLLTGLRGPMA